MKKLNNTSKLVTLKGELYWSTILQQYVALPICQYESELPFAKATAAPVLEVTDWAWYADGTEAGSQIIGTKNTNPTTLSVDVIYLFRTGLQETSGNLAKDKNKLNLEFNKDSGGYTSVTTSSDCRSFASANLTDGADTTQRLTAFSFKSPNACVANADAIAGDKITDLINNGTEILYAIKFVAAGTYQLRITDDGNLFDVYNQTDTSVVVTAGSTPETVTITKATMAQFVGQDYALNETVVMAKATFAQFIGQAIETSNPVVETITKAIFAPFSGQNVFPAETFVISKATFQPFIGQAITFSGAVVETITAGVVAIFAGRSLTPIQSEVLTVAAATVKQFIGRALTVVQATHIVITAATTQWVGRSITITAVGARAVHNMVKPLTKTVRRIFKVDPNDKNKDHEE